MEQFSLIGAFGLVWGYNPSKQTGDRSAEDEVKAFQKHAARGVRHYLLGRFLSWTAVFILISPTFLAWRYGITMGVLGYVLGAAIGLALIYGYARVVWAVFKA